MKTIFLFALAAIFFTSCNNSGNTAKTFCDTACNSDSIKFNGTEQFKQSVTITLKDCEPDSLSWTHEKMENHRKIFFRQYVTQSVRLNKIAVSAAFQDTTNVWLTFNDCITGRSFLFRLPYRNDKEIGIISGALNSFDKKFSVDTDLRAYTDRGNIFVVNVTNGKTAEMTFKENYKDIDFNDVHKFIDSINVTKNRLYVKLLKEGKEVVLEKNISL